MVNKDRVGGLCRQIQQTFKRNIKKKTLRIAVSEPTVPVRLTLL